MNLENERTIRRIFNSDREEFIKYNNALIDIESVILENKLTLLETRTILKILLAEIESKKDEIFSEKEYFSSFIRTEEKDPMAVIRDEGSTNNHRVNNKGFKKLFHRL